MPGTARSRAPLAAAAATTALLLAGCSSPGSAVDGRTGFVTGKDGVATAAPDRRRDVPDLSGATPEGVPVKLSDYRGKVVVLNLWGSWCTACRTEAPGLQAVWEQYRDQGVQFLGIDTRDSDPANAIAFERNKGITFPSLYDPDGSQILRFPEGSLNLQAIPTTVVVDREGRLAARVFGAREPGTVVSMIRPVLAERAPGGS
ncbi:TlpA disulfide reductase family protein [Kitasatospora cineracea]|uniref:TlpA family protein disulfide reductase n=1 Tax=Kitasatospora cineracea TaxID=88074 RepID=UPI00342B9515